jgi:hypothetical protein
MTLKGFESAFDDEERVRPIKGTMAYLNWVDEQKKIKEAQHNPVNKSLLITQDTIPATQPVPVNPPDMSTQPVPVTRTVRTTRTVPSTQPVPVTRRGVKVINDDGGVVSIETNYMRFDMDIFRAIRDMTYGEQGIYLDLIRRAYGAYPKAQNICSCTYTELSETSGVTSRDSISNAITSLESKGYILRLVTAYKKGDKSLYRVYLPCEIMGNNSRTKITISKGD